MKLSKQVAEIESALARLSALAPLVEAVGALIPVWGGGGSVNEEMRAVRSAFDALQNPAADTVMARSDAAVEKLASHFGMVEACPDCYTPFVDGKCPRGACQAVRRDVTPEPPTDRDRRIVAAAEAWRKATTAGITDAAFSLIAAVDLPESAGDGFIPDDDPAKWSRQKRGGEASSLPPFDEQATNDALANAARRAEHEPNTLSLRDHSMLAIGIARLFQAQDRIRTLESQLAGERTAVTTANALIGEAADEAKRLQDRIDGEARRTEAAERAAFDRGARKMRAEASDRASVKLLPVHEAMPLPTYEPAGALSMYRCTKHGGYGFISDCTECAKDKSARSP